MISDEFLRKALKEDLGKGDLTTDAVVSKKLQGVGRFLAKQDLILCGTDIVQRLFGLLSPHVKIQFSSKDGDAIRKGSVFGIAHGPLHILLKGERTALNLLQRFSGISTLTHEYQKRIKHSKCKILDTRKTLPLYRSLEKYAVRMGSGENHRIGLYDQMMVKDNHIAACGGNTAKAVFKARNKHPSKILVVEIQKPSQIHDAIDNGADRLLLDNMTNQQIKACLKTIKKKVPTEVSGQIKLSRVASLSKLGVDYISVGAITHSARAADISFKISLIDK